MPQFPKTAAGFMEAFSAPRTLVEEQDGDAGLTLEATGWLTIHRDGQQVELTREEFAVLAKAFAFHVEPEMKREREANLARQLTAIARKVA